MTQILMPKATAVWLIDNTGMTFKQISQFCSLHILEVEGIADGDVAAGTVSYTHLPSPRDQRGSRMPSSA